MTSPGTARLAQLAKRSLIAELALIKDSKTPPHGPREHVDVALPFGEFKGLVRAVDGQRYESLQAATVGWSAPQVWLVTQKRVVARQFLDPWYKGLMTIDIALRPRFTELVIVEELPWKLFGRWLERAVAAETPRSMHGRILHHYGAVSDAVVTAFGGLHWHVLPTALIVDADNRIRWRTTGICDAADIAELNALLPTLHRRESVRLNQQQK